MRCSRRTCAQRALDPRAHALDYGRRSGAAGGGDQPMAQGLSRVAVSAIACGAFIVLLSFGIRSSFCLA
jgi:hypothetical protein